MGTIATQIAIGPWQLLCDLYVAGHALVTTYRWARKRIKFRVTSFGLGVRIGDGILTVAYDADRKGEVNTSASPSLVLSADAEKPGLHASKKGARKSTDKHNGKK